MARILQKQGFAINLSPLKRACRSAVYQLAGPIDLYKIPGHYEPEVINTAIVRRGSLTFSVFHTGKVIITGVQQLNKVYPVLLELEILSS